MSNPRNDEDFVYGKKRRCHDCGCPTYDYRCPKCWTAWRKKHDVSANFFDDAACLPIRHNGIKEDGSV